MVFFEMLSIVTSSTYEIEGTYLRNKVKKHFMISVTKPSIIKITNIFSRPSHLSFLIHDLLGRSYPPQANDKLLGEAIIWLCCALDAMYRNASPTEYDCREKQ